MRRLGLRNKPGRKPKWTFNKANGLLKRDGKGGIDFWRYLTEVAEPLLLPFLRECQRERPNTILLEDGAAPHKHHFVQEFWAKHGIPRLPWPGNSPDLNAIEPAWGHLKRKTTDRGAEKTIALLERRWRGEWRALLQSKIQGWIEKQPEKVAQVVDLKGRNTYHEGKQGDAARAQRRERDAATKKYWVDRATARVAGSEDQFLAAEARRWEDARYRGLERVEAASRVASEDTDEGWEDLE